jgi:hypothetical protein
MTLARVDESEARMKLAESGMTGATKPRIPLCCMRATY